MTKEGLGAVGVGLPYDEDGGEVRQFGFTGKNQQKRTYKFTLRTPCTVWSGIYISSERTTSCRYYTVDTHTHTQRHTPTHAYIRM